MLGVQIKFFRPDSPAQEVSHIIFRKSCDKGLSHDTLRYVHDLN